MKLRRADCAEFFDRSFLPTNAPLAQNYLIRHMSLLCVPVPLIYLPWVAWSPTLSPPLPPTCQWSDRLPAGGCWSILTWKVRVRNVGKEKKELGGVADILMVIFATNCQICLFSSRVSTCYFSLGGKSESRCDEDDKMWKSCIWGERVAPVVHLF